MSGEITGTDSRDRSELQDVDSQRTPYRRLARTAPGPVHSSGASLHAASIVRSYLSRVRSTASCRAGAARRCSPSPTGGALGPRAPAASYLCTAALMHEVDHFLPRLPCSSFHIPRNPANCPSGDARLSVTPAVSAQSSRAHMDKIESSPHRPVRSTWPGATTTGSSHHPPAGGRELG